MVFRILGRVKYPIQSEHPEGLTYRDELHLCREIAIL